VCYRKPCKTHKIVSIANTLSSQAASDFDPSSHVERSFFTDTPQQDLTPSKSSENLSLPEGRNCCLVMPVPNPDSRAGHDFKAGKGLEF